MKALYSTAFGFFLPLLGALSLFMAPSAEAARKAVLVGINEYPAARHRLKGSLNDLESFAEVLKSKFGFREEDIIRLTDSRATTHAVMETIKRELIDKLGPDDVAVFYYAGHGTFVPDLNGDEDDLRDEVLCTYDISGLDTGSWLTDDVMAALLRQVRARHTLVIYDCCHAGTGTRGDDGESIEEDLPAGVTNRFISLDYAELPATSLTSKSFVSDQGPSQHVFLGASRASETALEAADAAGVYRGAFTSALCRALETLNDTATFSDLAARILPEVETSSLKLTRQRRKQTPQFEGTHLGMSVQAFLSGNALRATATTAVITTTTAELAPAPAPIPTPHVATATPPRPASTPTPPSPLPSSLPAPAPTQVPVLGFQPQGKISVSLETDKKHYKDGDIMNITVTVDRDCHLRLYNITAENRVLQIFPNKFQKDHFVKAGKPVTIGGIEAPYEFSLRAPFGNELIKAVASVRPFTDAEARKLEQDLFEEFDDANIQHLSVRGIDVRAKENPEELGEALVIYNLSPKN